MPNAEVSEADREAALNRWIRHFQSPQLQQATLRHDVPQRLSQIEKEVYAKTSTAQEYEQYWNNRIQKIMMRIHNMPSSGGQGTGVQQQQQPAASPSPGLQPEQYHNAHMQQAAGPYAHMSSGQPVQMNQYRHAYEGAGHAGAAGVHANAYAQQSAARYSAMGPQAHQMHGQGDGYYPNMMYTNDQRGNMPDIMQTQHMPHQGGYRVNEQQYVNGAYGMMPTSHAPGDSQQRHSAALASSQQQRMSAAGAADSQYSNMRHPRSQQHSGQYAMQGGPMGNGASQAQHAGYNANSSAPGAGNGMTSGSTPKRMSSMVPNYNTPGDRSGMQQHMGDMSMPQQMQQTHTQHAQHPSQSNVMSQGASVAQGAGAMGGQGRDSTAGNTVTRNARERLGDGLGGLEPTPIDQIGLSADDDDFSDLADIIADPPAGTDLGPEMSQGHGPELSGDPYSSANAQLTTGGQNHGRMVSPRQWNPSMELMPQSMASPYTSPSVMPQQQHMQQQPPMHMHQPQGAAHGMGTRSAAQQPNGQAQWMADQQMHHTHQMRQQQQQQQGYNHSQQGYGQGPGYTHAAQQQQAQQQQAQQQQAQQQQAQQQQAQQQQQQQRHQAEQQAIYRHQEEQRNMTQQQQSQQPNDTAQVGQKQPPRGHLQEQQAKAAKMQHEPAQMAPQQQQQQPGNMPAAQAPPLTTTDSKMKVAQDAHREYRKAGEQVQTAHQLLRVVTNQAPQQSSFSPQAIAHLMQAKWVDAVKKAIGDYQHTERTLQRAVKILKTHTDRTTKEHAMQQLHKVATHARALQETLRQHIASAEAARVRFTAGGATQDPTAGTMLTPRSSNSVQGVTPAPFDTASAGQQQGQQGRALTPRQQGASSHSAGTAAGANGVPGAFTMDPNASAVAGAEGGLPQGSGVGTGAPAAPPKAKLRIRARGASAAAAQAASQAAEASSATARNDAGLAPGSAPGAQQAFQGSASGAPSPPTTTPPHVPPSVGSTATATPGGQAPVTAASASLPNRDPKAMQMHMYGDGNHLQNTQHIHPGAMGMGGAYGGQQGAGSGDAAPSVLSSGTQHRMMDHSMQGMGGGGQYGAVQYGAGGHAYGAHASVAAGGAGGNNAAMGNAGYRNAGASFPQHSMGAAAPSSGAAMSAGGVAAAAQYVMPSGGITKSPEADYPNYGNHVRLGMVPDSAQKTLLSASLNPVTHPVPPTSGIQSNSIDSDSTEVLSGPLRSPAPNTLSVCDLDLPASDRYSLFTRSVDPCAAMIHMPGQPPCTASDTSARPAAPQAALPLPDTEPAHRLVSVCSTLTAEFHVSLRPAKRNSLYSHTNAFTVAVCPLTTSSDGSNTGQAPTEDNSWCSIQVLMDAAAWDNGQQMCTIVWPQLRRDLHAQGNLDILEKAANELRSLMQVLLSETGMAPTLRSIVNAWCNVQKHMSRKLSETLK